jgi:hypothetical protein
VGQLDQLIEIGHKTYLENKETYQDAHFSSEWLAGAEEFSKWYSDRYLKMKKSH